MTTPFHLPSVAFIRSHLDNEGSSHLHGRVYALMQGPHFESPAEIKALQRLGATAVGDVLRESKLGTPELGVPYVAKVWSLRFQLVRRVRTRRSAGGARPRGCGRRSQHPPSCHQMA